MAGWFERFTKPLWSSGGTARSEPVDAQANSGFGFLGSEPPSVELFNAIFYWLDGKDRWMYQQIASVLAGANITPSEDVVVSLRDAIASQYQAKGSFPSSFRRNYLLNGQFAIFQRGMGPFTANPGGLTPLADRWALLNYGNTVTAEVKFATEADRIELGDSRLGAYLRVTVNGGTAADAISNLLQRMENVFTLAGKPTTTSFAIRRVAGAGDVAVEFIQLFGPTAAEFAASTVVIPAIGPKIPVTPTWRRVTVGANLPLAGARTADPNNKHGLQLNIALSSGSQRSSRLGGLGVQSATFDISMLQLEEGAQATNYDNVPVDIEFLRCLRYYQRLGVGLWGMHLQNVAGSALSTRFSMGVQSTVPLALSPSLEILSPNWFVDTPSLAYTSIPGVRLFQILSNPSMFHKITMDHNGAYPVGDMFSVQDAGYAALNAEFN